LKFAGCFWELKWAIGIDENNTFLIGIDKNNRFHLKFLFYIKTVGAIASMKIVDATGLGGLWALEWDGTLLKQTCAHESAYQISIA